MKRKPVKFIFFILIALTICLLSCRHHKGIVPCPSFSLNVGR